MRKRRIIPTVPADFFEDTANKVKYQKMLYSSILDGVEQTLNAISASAQTYASHTVTSDIQVFQINDYVFVLNRSIFVEDDGTSSAAQVPFGYATLVTIAYDTSYRITLDGTDFTYDRDWETEQRHSR